MWLKICTLLIVTIGFAQPGPIAVFSGVLPCADCIGIRTELTLYTRNAFTLEQTYLGTKDGDRTFQSSGRWTTLRGTTADKDATVFYQLNPDKPAEARYFLKISENEIKMLDREQREIQTKANYSLKRTGPRRPVGSYSPV
jgi:copper homeostasis protein (lipoprotein)